MSQMLIRHTFRILFLLVLNPILATQVLAQGKNSEALEAYRVCAMFQRILGENLDFSRAYEVTFTSNPDGRRTIAIKAIEFRDVDLTNVDTETIVDATKSTMQLIYLMLPLAGQDTDAEAAIFFPPSIKAMFERNAPNDPKEFQSFAAQLKQ